MVGVSYQKYLQPRSYLCVTDYLWNKSEKNLISLMLVEMKIRANATYVLLT